MATPRAILHVPASFNPRSLQAGPGLPAAPQEKQDSPKEALHLGLGHSSLHTEICPICGVSMGILTAGLTKGFHALHTEADVQGLLGFPQGTDRSHQQLEVAPPHSSAIPRWSHCPPPAQSVCTAGCRAP